MMSYNDPVSNLSGRPMSVAGKPPSLRRLGLRHSLL